MVAQSSVLEAHEPCLVFPGRSCWGQLVVAIMLCVHRETPSWSSIFCCSGSVFVFLLQHCPCPSFLCVFLLLWMQWHLWKLEGGELSAKLLGGKYIHRSKFVGRGFLGRLVWWTWKFNSMNASSDYQISYGVLCTCIDSMFSFLFCSGWPLGRSSFARPDKVLWTL